MPEYTVAEVLAQLTAAHTGGTLIGTYGTLIGAGDAAALDATVPFPTTEAELVAVIGAGDLDALQHPDRPPRSIADGGGLEVVIPPGPFAFDVAVLAQGGPLRINVAVRAMRGFLTLDDGTTDLVVTDTPPYVPPASSSFAALTVAP